MALFEVVWKFTAELGAAVVEAGSRARRRVERDRADEVVVAVRSRCWCRARGARALCVVAAVMVMAVYDYVDIDHEQLPVACRREFRVVGLFGGLELNWPLEALRAPVSSCAVVQAAVRAGTGVPTSESGLPEGAWALDPPKLLTLTEKR